MSGWTLVPESPQSAPQSLQSSDSWTPVEEPQAPPQESSLHELLDMGKLGASFIYSQMLGTDPAYAYKHHDDITQQLSKVSSDFAKRMDKASTVNDDPLSLAIRKQVPAPFESHDALENFVHSVSEFIADPVMYGPAVLGALAGPGGARAGANVGFTLDAGLRKMLVDHLQKGDVKSFGDLSNRAAATLWAAAKGYMTGKAMEYAGELSPEIGSIPGATSALRAAYQAASMEFVGSLLNGQMPTLEGFRNNAVTVAGFNLIAHGASVGASEATQGLMDVYAKDGTTPEQSAVKLQAQPPVKPEPPEGLRPAIRVTAKDGSTQVITGDAGETHAEMVQRVTGEKPVSVDELEANPKLADKVLNQPEIQTQDAIDRAMELTDASLGAPDDKAYLKRPPEPPKSGRGFSTNDGKFLNRSQAKKWAKENEPEVHDMWAQITGDPKAEFHSEDYNQARSRVANRNVMEGEPQLTGVSGEIQEFLAKNRAELNEVKAGNRSEGYGNTVIRSTFVGPKNFVRATSEQAAGKIAKLVPDSVDQEALSFMRDYRDDPNQLRAEIEEIRKGDNEKLKRAIPSMERALNPTPKMLEADKLMTEYFRQANDLRQQFVGVGSSIDPERYSPRNFMLAEDDQPQRGAGGGNSRLSKKSPHDIQREYLHMLEPLKSGDIEARTFNAVDELRVYGDRLSNSVATSVFQMELKNTELGKNGVRGETPRETRELKEEAGIPASWVPIQENGLMVPPEIAKAMKPIIENDVLSGAQYWRVAKYIQSYIKSIELGLSPFHMRAMAISYMNNNGLTAYRDALYSDNNSPEFEAQERKGALYGLTTTKTGVPIEAYRGLKPSSLESRDTLLSKIKSSYEPVDKLFKGMTKATFEVAQRKFKVMDFSAKEAQWLAKHPDATDAEYGTAMRSITKEINAVYGGLNWEVMGFSKNFQAVARMVILAPDWTFSNVANLKYSFEGGPGGNAARMFWLKSFVTGYALSQGMSMMLTGQPSKQWDKVYLGKDDKGKELYSSIFFVGAPKDAIGLVSSTMRDGFPRGTLEFAANKASPLVGTGLRLHENKDWQGKPISKPKDDFGEKSTKQSEFAAEQLLPAPFALKDMGERMLNPDEDLTYKDFIAGLAGATVYHEGPKQGKSTKRRGFSLKGSR
jgi:hypothetical protein